MENWIDTKRHGWRALGIGQEVGHAGDDASGRLGTNPLQRGEEDGEAAAGHRLSRLHSRIGSATVLVDVIPQIGVTNHGEDWRHFQLFLLNYS